METFCALVCAWWQSFIHESNTLGWLLLMLNYFIVSHPFKDLFGANLIHCIMLFSEEERKQMQRKQMARKYLCLFEGGLDISVPLNFGSVYYWTYLKEWFSWKLVEYFAQQVVTPFCYLIGSVFPTYPWANLLAHI